MNRLKRYLKEKEIARLESEIHVSVGAIRKILKIGNSWTKDSWSDRLACDWTKFNRCNDLSREDIEKGEIVSDKNGDKKPSPSPSWTGSRGSRVVYSDGYMPLTKTEKTGLRKKNIYLHDRQHARTLHKQSLPTCPMCAMFVDNAYEIRQTSLVSKEDPK